MNWRDWVTYRVILLNTHTGLGLKHGVVGWIRRVLMARVNIMLVSEVRHRADLVRVLSDKWLIVPGHRAEKHGTNYVCLKQQWIGRPGKRRKRFQVMDTENQDITFGGKYGRAMVGLLVWDELARRFLCLSSLHPDPLGAGLAGAAEGQLRRHGKQVDAHVEWHSNSGLKLPDIRSVVDICGGDTNERMDPDVWRSQPPEVFERGAVHKFREIGMRPGATLTQANSGEVRLMELFVNYHSWLKVRRRVAKNSGIRGMNHEVVAYWIKVKKQEGN